MLSNHKETKLPTYKIIYRCKRKRKHSDAKKKITSIITKEHLKLNKKKKLPKKKTSELVGRVM